MSKNIIWNKLIDPILLTVKSISINKKYWFREKRESESGSKQPQVIVYQFFWRTLFKNVYGSSIMKCSSKDMPIYRVRASDDKTKRKKKRARKTGERKDCGRHIIFFLLLIFSRFFFFHAHRVWSTIECCFLFLSHRRIFFLLATFLPRLPSFFFNIHSYIDTISVCGQLASCARIYVWYIASGFFDLHIHT